MSSEWKNRHKLQTSLDKHRFIVFGDSRTIQKNISLGFQYRVGNRSSHQRIGSDMDRHRFHATMLHTKTFRDSAGGEERETVIRKPRF